MHLRLILWRKPHPQKCGTEECEYNEICKKKKNAFF